MERDNIFEINGDLNDKVDKSRIVVELDSQVKEHGVPRLIQYKGDQFLINEESVIRIFSMSPLNWGNTGKLKCITAEVELVHNKLYVRSVDFA